MRTGHCWLCGAPSDPKGIGGEKERCVECKLKQARERRGRWSAKNKERETEMKKAYASSHRAEINLVKDAWRKANLERFNAAGKAWKRRNPGAMKKYRLKRYGLTVEQYDAMVVAQDGRCAICDTKTPAKHGTWCIDHDHDSGKVRGLLCVRCNAGLGNFDENIGFLLAAERYLQSHRSPASVRPPPGARGHLSRVA